MPQKRAITKKKLEQNQSSVESNCEKFFLKVVRCITEFMKNSKVYHEMKSDLFTCNYELKV